MPVLSLTKLRRLTAACVQGAINICRRACRFAAKYRKYRRLGNIHIVAWRLARDQQ